jgi:F-type H+-transporting ATPase subunit gamma
MPGGEERSLRRRIKSVQSTKKITRAMELISASRIVKAQQKVAAARPYAEQITNVIRNLSAAGAGGGQPLLTPRENVSTVGVIVLAADRGLAGGYNSSVIRRAEKILLEAEAEGHKTQLYAVGRKAVSYFRYRGREIAADFTGFTDSPTYEDARRIAEEVVSRFENGDVDRVELVFTQFISMGNQKPTAGRFVPLEPEAMPEGEKDAKKEGPQADYEYEPGPETILEKLLPRYVESRLFSALLEAAASEHAARQRAMKSATDNAGELITKLDRQMNRARQDSITTEIIEIASGAEALNQNAQGGGGSSSDYFTERDATPYDAHAS